MNTFEIIINCDSNIKLILTNVLLNEGLTDVEMSIDCSRKPIEYTLTANRPLPNGLKFFVDNLLSAVVRAAATYGLDVSFIHAKFITPTGIDLYMHKLPDRVPKQFDINLLRKAIYEN